MHTQYWTTQIKHWRWNDSNGYKQVRPQRSAWATSMLYISIPAFLLLFGLWKWRVKPFSCWYFYLFSQELLRWVVLPAESVKGFHVCLQYFCNWGQLRKKNGTMGLKSKINTDVPDTHMVSLQVKSSMFSESWSRCCSGPINFTVTYLERSVKSCEEEEEEEVQGGTRRPGIHAVTSPHLGCGSDWQRGENGSGQD